MAATSSAMDRATVQGFSSVISPVEMLRRNLNNGRQEEGGADIPRNPCRNHQCYEMVLDVGIAGDGEHNQHFVFAHCDDTNF